MATNGLPSRPALSDEQLLLINGKYVPAASGTRFPVTNPMTGSTIYECASAGTEDYEAAIQSAETAFQSWSQTPPSRRRMIFLKAADIIETYINQDAPEILAAEVSAVKSWIKLNVMATAGFLREAAGLVTHIKGEIVPADRPGTTIMVVREPVGVIFAISPWNAPMTLTARAVACPLICGNTVIMKPSEFSPKSQHLALRALHEAGLPPGCINFLPCQPSDAPLVTEFAINHPLVRHVNFTGSDRVGRIIAGLASQCLKKCVLELGGKAPVVVLDDADIDDAVNGTVFAGYSNSGQICMSAERVIVHKDIMDTFVQKLLERVGRITCGNHLLNPDVTISGLFTPKSAARVIALMKDAVDKGAKVLVGDLSISGPNHTIVSPHVLADVTPEMEIFQEESFGPLLCLSQAESEEDAIKLANNTEYSLSASVYSKDMMRALRVSRKIRTGACHINGPSVYIEAPLPNGGVGGRSGYGRFGGIAGVEEFTERKIISLLESGSHAPF